MSGSEIFLHIGSHCVAVLKPEHSDFSWSLTYTKDWKEKGFALSPTLPLEGNDLVVEYARSCLSLGDNLRFETAISIPWNRNGNRSLLGL